MRKHATVEFVQFLDADCTLVPGWITAGIEALTRDPACSAVVGEILERDVNASIYNRMCAIEWRTPPRETEVYGRVLNGKCMVRSEAFLELGGFREDVIAAEDTELGIRMSLAGYSVVKLPDSMAIHDADITRFGQWWRRSVRQGHAIGQRYDIHGKSPARDCVRERRSTWFWGIGLPVLILATVVPTRGASLLLLLGYLVLGLRMWRYRRRLGDAPRDALLYSAFGLIEKFANAAGLVRFYMNRLKHRYELIEYK
jgi:GT2 family glycosyltransferase